MSKQCRGKKSFLTLRGANTALDQIWKGSYTDPSRREKEKYRLKPCRAYRCSICNKWHLTSKADKFKTGEFKASAKAPSLDRAS